MNFSRVASMLPVDTHLPIVSYYFVLCFFYTFLSFAWNILAMKFSEKKWMPNILLRFASAIQSIKVKLNKKFGSNRIAIESYILEGQKKAEEVKKEGKDSSVDKLPNTDDIEAKIKILNNCMFWIVYLTMLAAMLAIWLSIFM